MPAANVGTDFVYGELRVPAYFWKDEFHKVIEGAFKERLPKGTKVKIHLKHNSRKNNSLVELLEDCDITGKHANLKKGQRGNITTAKIRVNAADHLMRLLVEEPSKNGIRKMAWSTEQQIENELDIVLKICGIVNDLVQAVAANETSVEKWKNIAMALTATQMATGGAILGLTIAASIVTFGAAVPIALAIGVAGATASAATLGAKGAMNHSMRVGDSSMPIKGVKATGDVTRNVYNAVSHAVDSGGAASAGAAAVAATATTVSGSAVGLIFSGIALHSLSKVDSTAMREKIDLKGFREILAEILEGVTSQRECYRDRPGLLTKFDNVIAELKMTVNQFPSTKT